MQETSLPPPPSPPTSAETKKDKRESSHESDISVVDIGDKPDTEGTASSNESTDVSTDETSADVSKFATYASCFVVKNKHIRECLAEFLGTFVMVCFGFGVNNQVSLSKDQNGTWLSVNMCWGVAVMLGVHCSEGISGAHINPAVTIAMATYKRLSWRKVPGYILAQCLGAFVGAAAVFALNYELLNAVDPKRTFTRANFATYPSKGISNTTAFYTEFLATGMLLLGIFAITDKHNRPASPFGAPLHFMVLTWAIGMAFGMNTGYAINPARDFAPRLFTSMAGYGAEVFTVNHHYFWIPIFAPTLGAICGAGVYKLLVENHHHLHSELPVYNKSK